MSAWEDVKSGFRSVANKVICRTDELAEEASLSIKKKTAEAHLTEAYQRLGRACAPILAKEGEDPRADADVIAAMKEVAERTAELEAANEAIRRFKNATAKTGGTQTKSGTSSDGGSKSSSEEEN